MENKEVEKVLLITGASSDVGIKLLESVYKNYGVIYVQYRNMNDELEQLVDKIRLEREIFLLKTDFSKDEDVQGLINAIRERNIYPNNIVHLPAPKAYNSQFHKDKWENYELGWKISVRSIVEILKAFVPYMAKLKYGRVVFLLSSYTINIPPKFQSSYVTVKYALLGLMKSLSAEYIGKGITVNAVSPDMMETKFLSEIPEMIISQNAMNSPIGRNIYVNEVIPVISYMLSDFGASMTGQNVAITGGNR